MPSLTEKGALRYLDTVPNSEAKYHEKKVELKRKFGKEPSPGDIAWGVLNDYALSCMQQKDFPKLSTTYYTMASFG